MRKDITKKFLGKENRYLGKMLSKEIVSFIARKKINRVKKQIGYDEIEFRNVFSTNFTNLNTKNLVKSGYKIKEVVSKDGKRIEFNMIYCASDKTHSDFLLGETEVTQELYELVMGYNPSYYKGIKDSSKRPVECISWYDAVLFCNKLSELQDKNPYYEIWGITYENKTQTNIKEANVEINKGANGFRLPSEQEWEYAAKAGTNNKWSGTNDKSKVGEYAWFLKNSDNETHPVATKKPNEWGFYDMSGSVWELCFNEYLMHDRVYYINRGGCWSNHESDLHSAIRIYNLPESRGSGHGFRVSASL